MSITKDDIKHLGDLSRIKLSDQEIDKFQEEVDSILGYVSAVNDIVADGDLTKKVGPVHNIFREDEVTNPHNTNPDELIAAFPEKDGRYLKVKKILQNDE